MGGVEEALWTPYLRDRSYCLLVGDKVYCAASDDAVVAVFVVEKDNYDSMDF